MKLKIFKAFTFGAFVTLFSLQCYAAEPLDGDFEPLPIGDSLIWPQRRQEGFDHWRRRMAHLPVLRSTIGEAYLDTLGKEFIEANQVKILPSMTSQQRRKIYGRNVRFQFYIADTMNPSIWSQGGGAMILHGGVISQAPGFFEFNYLLALEMAHEALGHPVPDPKPAQLPFFSSGYNEQTWSADGFATLVLDDPILSRKFSYSLQQESEALAMVWRFFRTMGWDFEGTSLKILPGLQAMIAVPRASSLGLLHKNLGMALKLPISQEATVVKEPPAFLSVATFRKFRDDLQRSFQQRSPWLMELAAYLGVINNPASSAQKDLQKLAELEAASKELQNSFNHRRVHAWIKNRIYLNHKLWNEAQESTKESIAKNGKLEPFLYQRALALQLGDKPEICVREFKEPWLQFDHLRELINIQCLLFDGQITSAQQQAASYAQAHPEEVQGQFWQVLLLQRLHLPEVNALLKNLDAKWGDRPYVRALHIIQLAQQAQWQKLQELMSRGDLDIYSQAEKGALDFAKAWASFQQDKLSQGLKYLKQSREFWFPAYRNNQVFPQELK